MITGEFRANLQNLKETIDILLEKKAGFAVQAPNLHDFQASKRAHHEKRYLLYVSLLKRSVAKLQGIDPAVMLDLHHEVNLLDNLSLEMAKSKVERIAQIFSEIDMPKTEKSNMLTPKNFPAEIKKEAVADINEIKRCYDAQAYRAVIIICGRLLETALHWKYYNETGIDLLEKNPGIGLGNIIAKLSEKNIQLEPGLSQQIHLINQVRVFSVHTKKEVFMPTQKQAEAIMLYSMDVLEKIVK